MRENDLLKYVPVIDRGDPRLSRAYEDSVQEILRKELLRCPPGAIDETTEQASARCGTLVRTGVKRVQERFTKETWYALRLDFGLAGTTRVLSASVEPENWFSDRGGVWVRRGIPLGSTAQLSAVGRASWARADSAADELARHTAGARIRWFPRGDLGVSAEAAEIWSEYGRDSLDDSWTHVAAAAEIPLS